MKLRIRIDHLPGNPEFPYELWLTDMDSGRSGSGGKYPSRKSAENAKRLLLQEVRRDKQRGVGIGVSASSRVRPPRGKLNKLYSSGWTQRVKILSPGVVRYYFIPKDTDSNDKRIAAFIYGGYKTVEVFLLRKISRKKSIKIESRMFNNADEMLIYLHELMRIYA